MRGKASVAIAKQVLESRGCTILKEGERITVEGLEVGEVDLIARGPQGALLAVEVKAGQASASDVKQLYVNALILGAKPLLVARTLSEEALALARKLGVEVLLLRDLLTVDEEELYEVVKAAVSDAILELLLCLRAFQYEEAVRILEAIAKHENLGEAAEALNLEVREIERKLGELRNAKLIPPLHGYKALKLYAEAFLTLRKLIN